MSSRLVLCPLLTMLCCSAIATADNWPAWRGSTGQGFANEKSLPLKWSATENVKWKIPLEDQANSTPVIWGDAIFLTQANKGGTVRSLMCLARADGKLRWKKDVTYNEPEKNWNPAWYCNASPATDGERVVVSFGSAGLYCYDLAGKELWKRTELGKWEDAFGNSASPVIQGDLVIQWCGPNRDKGRNYLLAVEKKTGKTVWEHDESFASWITPVIAKVNDKEQLIVSQSRDLKGKKDPQTGYLKGFDPATGKELWSCRGLDSFQYASPLISKGVAVGMSGYGGSALAVKLGGTGDITSDRLWVQPKPANQRIGSGVIIDEHIYIIDENGTPRCYELATGKNLWDNAEKFANTTWGSMLHANGRLYTLMKNGDTIVLAANPKFEVLAVNPLDKGEQTYSSLAVSDGEIFIRTFKHLYCITEKK